MNPTKCTGMVLIGRNEGLRLQRCLASVMDNTDYIVYVDSGSTDDSVKIARSVGAEVVILKTSQPFTAGRARNEGFKQLIKLGKIKYVQFIDGDCELIDGWIEAATAFLENSPTVAVVCGRRREKFPENSVYNRLCDWEWDTPVGNALACGGDALYRVDAFAAVNGFNSDIIAGEEPELCVRLRANGWRVWRLDQEMTLHDAAMDHFGQWWMRSKRGGFAFAEGFARHGRHPELHFAIETFRAIVWGLILPLMIIGMSLATPWALGLVIVYPIQIIRLALREGVWQRMYWERAFYMTLAKFAETQGILSYVWRRITQKPTRLIEYK